MQKAITIMLIIFLVILAITYVSYNNIEAMNMERIAENKEYAYYLDKTISGTDLATLMNKAINHNEQNEVEKNEKNHYIENETNSIKIEIKMIQTKKTYPMEEFYNNDITKFVEYYRDEGFKCTSIDYHKKSGRIKSMLFEQVEEI